MHFDINLVLILDFCTSLDQSSCNIYCFILGARCSWRQCRRLLSPKHLDCLLLDLPNTAGTAHEISRIDHWISRNSLEIHQDFSTFLEDLEKSYGEILLKFCFILFLCEALVFPVSCIFSAANWNNWKISNPLPTLCILYPSLCAEISADIHRASDLLRSRHPSLVAQGRPQPSNVDSTRFSTCFITYHHLCQVDSPTKEWLKSVTLQVEFRLNGLSMSFQCLSGPPCRTAHPEASRGSVSSALRSTPSSLLDISWRDAVPVSTLEIEALRAWNTGIWNIFIRYILFLTFEIYTCACMHYLHDHKL